MAMRMILSGIVITLFSHPTADAAFHPDDVSLQGLESSNKRMDCPALTDLPLPTAIEGEYESFINPSAEFCGRLNVAYNILSQLVSDQNSSRYHAIRFLYTVGNKIGFHKMHELYSSFSRPDQPNYFASILSSQLNFLAVFDRADIASYAKNLAQQPLSIQNQSISGLNLADRDIAGELCYHVAFQDVNLTNSRWSFSQVTRFCNFTRVQAAGLKVRGWLINQTFESTDLQNSSFDLQGPQTSSITFRQSDLRNARITGNLTQVNFIDSDLSGAYLNGVICTDKQGSGCL